MRGQAKSNQSTKKINDVGISSCEVEAWLCRERKALRLLDPNMPWLAGLSKNYLSGRRRRILIGYGMSYKSCTPTIHGRIIHSSLPVSFSARMLGPCGRTL